MVFLLILLGSVMDLVSFTGILWSKSVLLVCVVLGYSLLGTLLTALIGRRLVRLNFDQLKYEADFRYSLVHVRDNTESIAFYQGEASEIKHISGRFGSVLKKLQLIDRVAAKSFLFYNRPTAIFLWCYRFLVLFPQYFGGEIEYGDMVQANFAFTQVYAALSLIVSQIEQITGFAAGVKRLSDFSDTIDKKENKVFDPKESKKEGLTGAKSDTRSDVKSCIYSGICPGIHIDVADQFMLDRLTLKTPDKRQTLFRNLSLSLERSQSMVVVGPSGVGKSSLLRAIAGLWTEGTGLVKRPDLGDIFFLPQKPYMLLGTLRDQLLYPQLDRQVDESRLHEILADVRLENLPERAGGLDVALDWADVLSLGEQQRLAFARLLANRPGWAVLDEATSALDTTNETNLYARLQDLDIRYISVGHRPTILKFHGVVLELKSRDDWELLPVDQYLSNQDQ